MQYDAMVKEAARSANVDPKTVRTVLAAIPDILVSLDEGEKVRTPLGVFRMTQRKGRQVTIPTSDEKVAIGPEMVVKLKSGSKLRREV